MPDWADDDTVMNELKHALAGSAAVSERSRTAARAAFAWRTIDEELMMLSHDSSVAADVLVRGATLAEPRVVSFQGRGFTLELELDNGNVIGQVVPGRVCRITVVSPSGVTIDVESDVAGFFSASGLDQGPVRFTVEVDGVSQTTEWLTL